MGNPFRIAAPIFLILFPVILVILILYAKNKIGKEPRLHFSSLSLIKSPSTFSFPQRAIFLVIRSLALILIALALLRPQRGEGIEEIRDKGIDLVLALDVSGSMKALDFLPKNRLEGAKGAAKEFIQQRKGDRIGLVVFAANSYTQCPLTLDHEQLKRLLDTVQIGMIEDGTAIGLAISSGVNRLKDSDAQTKVIVLLTDGINNAGEIDPMTAAQMAKYFGVKVYTIGAGKTGMSLYPVEDESAGDDILAEEKYVRVLNQLDEPALKAIADQTGGRYFRVEDKLSLDRTFQEIDRLEKVGIVSRRFKNYVE
ncbi:MAG: VWA domain-containing protein, partial [Candidatus Omnitrophota bacterium]